MGTVSQPQPLPSEDSLVIPHFRLGLGVNQIFRSLEAEVDALVLHSMIAAMPMEEVVARHAESFSPGGLDGAAGAANIIFEGTCDCIVDSADLFNLVILQRDAESKTFVELSPAQVRSFLA